MVSIALVYDIIRWEEKDLLKKAERLNLKVKPVKADSTIFPIAVSSPDRDKVFKDFFEADIALQRSISLYVAHSSTLALESMGLRVVNNSLSISIAGNKLWSTVKLVRGGIQVPDTIIAFSRETSLNAAKILGYPLVVKPIHGSWGRLVACADDHEDLETIIEHREYMGNPLYKVYYLQKYVHKPGRDIRVFVIGDEVPVAIYRVSARWKTNTALGGKAVPATIDSDLEEMALKTAKTIGIEIAGLDIFEDPEKGYIVNEVNHNTEYRNTVRVTGVDLSSKILEYLRLSAKR